MGKYYEIRGKKTNSREVNRHPSLWVTFSKVESVMGVVVENS